MTLDLRAVREGYKTEYPVYKDLAQRARNLLSAALTERGLKVDVDGRPKEVSSFLRKAIRKHAEKPSEYADPLNAITDKAGIRAVVETRDDAELVRGVVEELFDSFDFEDTASRLEPHELGYLGWHLQARLRDTDLAPSDQHLRGRQFEIQIHTIAQHAWSVVSHPIVYKPLGSQPPPLVASRIFRAVALVSLFDEEVSAVQQILRESPDYFPNQMLTAVDELFVTWVRDQTDDQLSLQVLGIVQHAYRAEELTHFRSTMDEFVREKRADLDVLYGQYEDTSDDYPLLFQPESLAI
jgi:putative GTP pyrophosphokinase